VFAEQFLQPKLSQTHYGSVFIRFAKLQGIVDQVFIIYAIYGRF